MKVLFGKSVAYKSKYTLKPLLSQNMVLFDQPGVAGAVLQTHEGTFWEIHCIQVKTYPQTSIEPKSGAFLQTWCSRGCSTNTFVINSLKKIPHTGDTNSLDRCG